MQIARGDGKTKTSVSGTVLCTVAVSIATILVFNYPRFVSNFIYGIFGIYVFSLLVLLFVLGIARRKIKVKRRYLINGAIMLFALFASIHLAFTHGQVKLSFAEYKKEIEIPETK